MKKVLLFACLSVCVNLFSLTYTKAQTCSSTLSNGQNLVTNGDFSQGYTGWTHASGYTNYTYCSGCYSVPGDIYVHDNAYDFNHAFTNASNVDHSSSSDGMMLMVDGVCTNGIDLWSQSNIPVVSNTFYYFSVWISSLTGAPKTLGKLNFSINGGDLLQSIDAPSTTGNWVKVTGVWNSGAFSGNATISIQNSNTSGCSDGVDFAIDDISFSPGCDFGSPGPIPNLGPDFSICGKTLPFNINPNFDLATQNSSNVTYHWYKDGVEVATGSGLSSYNLSVNAPGTYAVCTDSMGTCKKTDILVISNTYSVYLGQDQALCNPIVAALDARYTGPGVTYQWSSGGAAISGATNQTYTVNTPGTYSVLVHDPSCGDKSDTIGITTLAAVANNGTYCRTSGTGKASLSVTGTGKYKWWSTPNTSGTALATGPSYTTPVLTGPGPYTYYVQDTSTFSVTAGPPATGNGFTNVASISGGDNNSKLTFNALTSFRIDTITVLPYNYYCPGPPYTGGNPNVISFIIYDSSGAVVGTTPLYSAQCQGQGTPAPPLKVPVGINIPQGNGYQIRLNTGSTQFAIYLNTTNGGNTPSPELYHYPTTYSNAIQFVGNNTQSYNLYYSPDAIPGYFDWKITKGVNCQFVPVYATEVCPSCVSIVAPISINSSVTSFCKGSVSTIDITAVGGSGDSLILYKGSCGGTRVAANATGAAFSGITAPTTTTTYFARWESAPNCKSACVSVTVTPIDPPSTSNPGTNQTICNVTSATLNAKRPLIGIGAWSVVSGTGSITNTADSLSTVTGIGAGDLILKWKITNNPCPADSNNVTIHRNVSVVPDSIGKIMPYCNDGNTSIINLTVYGGMGDSLKLYKGSCGGIRVGANATGAPFTNIPAPTTATTYFARWESANGCNSPCDSLTVTPVELPSTSNPGTNQTICNVTTATLNAVSPAIGTGVWSVLSGTGSITDTLNPQSTVTGIGAGNLILKWTVKNSPCPASVKNDTIRRVVSTVPDSIGKIMPYCNNGTTSTINLIVYGGMGDSLILYKGSCGGTRIGANATGAPFTNIPAPTTATTYFARWESANGCNSPCDSLTITPVELPSTSNPGTNQTICNVTTATLNAASPAIGIGAWSVVSGTGSITDSLNPQSTVTGIGAGNLVLKWTVKNSPCPASIKNDTIRRVVSVVPDSIGKVAPYCNGSIGTINLTVYGGSGDSLVLYSGSCGGIKVGSNATGAAFTNIPAPTTATAYFARWESVNGCNSPCDSLTVTPVELPQNVNAVTPINICDVTTTNLHALSPTIGTGVWSVISGTGTVTNPADSLSGVTGLTVGDLKLAWTVSNSPCPDTTVNVTIHRDTLTPPVIAGSSFDTCALLTAVVYSTTVNQPASTYSWTTPGAGTTLNVTSQINNTATVDIGASGGILKVTETLGSCAFSDSVTVTIAPNIVQPAIADSVQAQCISTGVLGATAPLVGTGYWTVKSGSAFIVDPSDPQSAVSGLGNGVNILTWTVTGCGGPLSFDVKFNVSASDLILHATGPTDTTCAGKERDMSVAVTGGSGGFLYGWTSSDHSFSTTTKNTNVAVSPGAGVTTYYVIATDTANSGCISNIDSVKIHAVADQVLTNNNLLTPNRDGLNERLIVTDLNTHQAILPGSSLEVYNRWGERVFKSESYDNNWDAEGLNDGIYYYSIKAGCGGGKFNGWIQIIDSTVK